MLTLLGKISGGGDQFWGFCLSKIVKKLLQCAKLVPSRTNIDCRILSCAFPKLLKKKITMCEAFTKSDAKFDSYAVFFCFKKIDCYPKFLEMNFIQTQVGAEIIISKINIFTCIKKFPKFNLGYIFAGNIFLVHPQLGSESKYFTNWN